MHRGESDKRGIYGETSPDQAEALAEEGIEFSRIPWGIPARTDRPLRAHATCFARLPRSVRLATR